jgi:hypothetical protein
MSWKGTGGCASALCAAIPKANAPTAPNATRRVSAEIDMTQPPDSRTNRALQSSCSIWYETAAILDQSQRISRLRRVSGRVTASNPSQSLNLSAKFPAFKFRESL